MRIIACGMMAILLAGGLPSGVQAKDKAPEIQVTEQLDAALNAGRAPAASALFADDAVVKTQDGATAEGKVQVDAWLDSVTAQSWRMDSGVRQLGEGGRVTYPTSLAWDAVRRLNAAPVDAFVEAVILGGKIRSLTIRVSAAAQLRIMQAKAKASEAVARGFAADVLGRGDAARADALLSGAFQDHDPMPGKTADAAGLKAGIADLRASFPDLACSVEDVLVSGDRVAVRGTMSGTQQGPFLGAPASGRAFRTGFVEIYRIADGRIAERWGSRDSARMLDQLGISCGPVAAASAATATPTGKAVEKPGEKPSGKSKDQKKSGWF